MTEISENGLPLVKVNPRLWALVSHWIDLGRTEDWYDATHAEILMLCTTKRTMRVRLYKDGKIIKSNLDIPMDIITEDEIIIKL